ncbi:hypothetical protein [Streptomyces sp. TLI_171]|uniref:amidohydrolase family protein n=1 Tax=Streptomyces sp. TLI_171 TaxID=1938859 RepID=UPI000C1988F2|nr:hypothetical protein [Streptomyces sp. TLI_171]RKE20703.1 hypothetical protein BX266_4073 [Streptomyces sp. TLI_171]
MLTLHRAAVLVADPAAPSLPDGAVLVDGALVAAIGPYRELAGGPARLREWPGVLVPGLVNRHAGWLLEHAYHPDPREESGEQPLPPPDGLGEEQWGGSARRGLQRMLGCGATAVAGPFTRAAVRTAVARSGLRPLPGDGTPGPLDPLAAGPLAAAVERPLRVGGAADFAVFDAASAAELEHGGASCLATVLGARLLYRRK